MCRREFHSPISLNEYERTEAEWIKDVGEKIDAAIAASAETEPIDGETFINQILDRFRKVKQTQ